MPTFGDFLNNSSPESLKKFNQIKKAIAAEMNAVMDERFAKPEAINLVEYLAKQYPDAYRQILKDNQLDLVQADRKIEESDYAFIKKALIGLVKAVPITENYNRIYDDIVLGANLRNTAERQTAMQLLTIAGNERVGQIFKKNR